MTALLRAVIKCCFCSSDSLTVWVITQMWALSGTTGPLPLFLLVFISYASLSLSPVSVPLHACPLPPFQLCRPSSPLSFDAFVLCSDYMRHDLYNGFTAPAALWSITCIPEYFPASTSASIFFLHAVLLVCIYLVTRPNLPISNTILQASSFDVRFTQFHPQSSEI